LRCFSIIVIAIESLLLLAGGCASPSGAPWPTEIRLCAGNRIKASQATPFFYELAEKEKLVLSQNLESALSFYRLNSEGKIVKSEVKRRPGQKSERVAYTVRAFRVFPPPAVKATPVEIQRAEITKEWLENTSRISGTLVLAKEAKLRPGDVFYLEIQFKKSVFFKRNGGGGGTFATIFRRYSDLIRVVQ